MPRSPLRRHHGAEGGFTLVELLVVIVILGVLSGIVVFAVGGISNKSTKASCSSDVATVQTAEEANYAITNAYVAPATLVTNKLLRGVPTNSRYVITVPDLTAGTVIATPLCSTL